MRRILAENLGIWLDSLEISVDGHADVRGALMVSAEAPVGFRYIQCRVALYPADGASPEAIKRLMAATERFCVVL